MSEPNDPVDDAFDARLRHLVADAVEDAPTPPSPEEMTQMPRPTTTGRSRPTTTWVAGGAIGLAAAAIIALIVIPQSDDDALTPVDTVPATSTDPTTPESVPPTTVAPIVGDTASTVPNTPETSEPSSTSTVPPVIDPPTVIAALDAGGDAVLVSADGTETIELVDGPDPDAPPPDEGPGPNVVDSIALSPDGGTAYVGFCCEPIAGSVLAGPPAALGDEQLLFGYAPAVSPDGRLLAIGQIAGPATALYDTTTLDQLDVETLSDEVGTYTPFDTMWLDEERVVGLGTLPTDGGAEWVAVPMVVAGDEVTVGEMLDINEQLPANDDGSPITYELVRFAGQVDADHFAIHIPGATDAISIEFRLDGVTNGNSRAGGDDVFDGVGEPARSIWYQPGGTMIWVGEDGALHRGDETFEGDYLWARPTHATVYDTTVPPAADPLEAIDLDDASIFGYSYGSSADPDDVIRELAPILGDPSFDTGQQATPTEQYPCVGPAWRTLWWGDVRMTFELSDTAAYRLIEWSVGDPEVHLVAPLGDLPPSIEPSDVSVTPSGVGVGSSRDDALAAAEAVGRMVGDEGDQVVVTGPIVTAFSIEDDVVTGIGSGRLDCNVGDNL